MNYCVLFPNAENVHLIKDVGMIGYKLNKKYGFNSIITCYENGTYPYIESYTKGLKLDFIKKIFNIQIADSTIHLLKKGKSIDILQVFHMSLATLTYILIYKMINKNGKIFLKLDCDENLIKKLGTLNSMLKNIVEKILLKTSVIGVERKDLLPKLTKLLPLCSELIKLVPNGIDYDLLKNEIAECERRNTIINVSRLGSSFKNIRTLVEAFTIFVRNAKTSWELVLIGPTDRNFDSFISEFLSHNSDLIGRIILKNEITDRKKLFKEYKSSKIYCSPSLIESFGISMLEASALGNVLICTKVGIGPELADCGRGIIIDDLKVENLAEQMNYAATNNKLKSMSEQSIKYCKENFDWDKIVEDLFLILSK